MLTRLTTSLDILIAQPRFEAGEIITTPGFRDLRLDHTHYLAMHQSGLWGELNQFEAQANEWGVNNNGRILSLYSLPQGPRFLVITAADRSYTLFLLEEEF